MKKIALRMVCLVFMCLSMLIIVGCNDRQTTPGQTTQNVSGNEEPALKDLETKTGLSFPTNTVLVNSGDGGGRDASYGFYEWVVFSPAQIKMPLMQATGVKDYLNLPLADTVEFVESKMRKRKLTQPQSAFSSEWQTNGYEFRGTIVRTPQGDYLVVERFRKK